MGNNCLTIFLSRSDDPLTYGNRDDSEKYEEMEGWLNRMHAVVVGPGLGDDEAILNTVQVCLRLLVFEYALKFYSIFAEIDHENKTHKLAFNHRCGNHAYCYFNFILTWSILYMVSKLTSIWLQDGLRLVYRQPSLIGHYTNTTITPNAPEFERLAKALVII